MSELISTLLIKKIHTKSISNKFTAKMPVIRRRLKTIQYEKSAAIGVRAVQTTLAINV